MDDKTVTVQVWQGSRSTRTDDLLDDDPDVYEVPIADTEWGDVWEVSDDERVMLANAIEHHGTYAFDVPDPECPVTLYVHTNGSYHNREDWGDPMERGLTYHPGDDYPPFGCELWGRVMMWVDRPEDSESA